MNHTVAVQYTIFMMNTTVHYLDLVKVYTTMQVEWMVYNTYTGLVDSEQFLTDLVHVVHYST